MKVETFNSQLSKVLEYEFYALLANLNNVFAVSCSRKSDNLCTAVVRSNEHTVECVESNCSLLRVVYNDVVTSKTYSSARNVQLSIVHTVCKRTETDLLKIREAALKESSTRELVAFSLYAYRLSLMIYFALVSLCRNGYFYR